MSPGCAAFFGSTCPAPVPSVLPPTRVLIGVAKSEGVKRLVKSLFDELDFHEVWFGETNRLS